MFGFGIGSIGWQELVIILVIVLIIFGPGKLPQVGAQMGKALKSFRQAKSDFDDDMEDEKEKIVKDKDKDE